MKHEGSCSCGQLRFTYDGEILKTSLCHCFACQKRTGSVFGVQTRITRIQTTITGESTKYTRTGDGGSQTTFHFCPTCGATVYYEAEWLGESIAVPIGVLTNPGLPSPLSQIYGDRKHHWVTLPETTIEYFG